MKEKVEMRNGACMDLNLASAVVSDSHFQNQSRYEREGSLGNKPRRATHTWCRSATSTLLAGAWFQF
ncbi:hypothetical protein CLOM_g18550 [Closterium sp. NIES-68]|nr:hypothetical protein CLOM_g18550 [Closterium sp. NIES-68]GJP64332.1 hypothetical protein CLOP_g21339 [Closterium sp. NIES-67]